MTHTLWNIAAWALVMAVSAGAGNAAFRALRLPKSPLLDTMLISLAFGLGLLITGVALLGWLQLFDTPWLIALTAGLGAVAAGNVWQVRNTDLTEEIPASATEVYPRALLLLGIVAFAAVYLLSSLAPPLEGDTLHSYLDVPRQFLDAGGITTLPYEQHSAVPLNMQMLSVLALSLAGDELAQMLVGFTMAAGASLVIFALGRRYFSREIGTLAALIFLSMNTIQSMVPSTKVNLGWAFFDLLAVYAISRWAFDTPRDNRWLLAGGVLSGLAIGTLYSGAFTVVLLGLAILAVLLRQRRGPQIRAAGLYVAPVLLLGIPWLIRNWADVGNPVFPVLNTLFGLEPLALSRYGDNNPAGIARAPWDMATGYIVGSFGRPIGPVVLGALPGLVLARPVHGRIKVALVFVAVWYVLWYLGVQRPRNMLTLLGIVSIVSAYGYVRLGRRSDLIRYGFVAVLGLYLLCNLAFYAHGYFIHSSFGSYFLGLETREQFLDRTLIPSGAPPTLSMLREIEPLPRDTRIVAMYNGNGYYVPRPFIDSRMVDGVASRDTASDADALVTQWRQAGITHVFISDGYLDKATSWGADLDIVRSREFRERCLGEVFVDRGQYLYELLC